MATKICSKSGKCIELPSWERFKCNVGGRALRTACNTVSNGDRAKFRAGQIAQGRISERADDFLAAWGVPLSGNAIQQVDNIAGIKVADLAQLHLDNVVPTCLEYEAGRHTCHPEQPPGIEFYNLAREQFRSDIRAGKFKWRHTPRGGTGGGAPIDCEHESLMPQHLRSPQCGGPGGGKEEAPSMAGMGLLAAAAVAAFFIFR